jgi:hypothetical protein
MKTEIYPGPGPLARSARMVFRGAVAIAALAAANLFAAPTVQTLGGGASGSHSGYANGETLNALFNSPKGLALDSSGDLFIADYGNNAIREITDLSGTGNGVTETWDKSPNINAPVGVVFDAGDNLYVLNRGGTSAFSTNGSVIEYDMYGFLIGTNATHLTNAAAITLDTAGNIYVTERTNLVIRISGLSQTNVATVTASNAMLQGIVAMPNGFLAVCDSRRNGIYNIDPNTGIWTTNAGFNGSGDGTGPNNVGVPNSMAKFLNPYGVVAAGDGTLIVSDYGNDRVKVITAAGITTNLYGVSSNDWDSQFPGWVDGTVSIPDEPGGVAGRSQAGVLLSPDGTTVYTTEDYYHTFRKTTGTSFATFVPAPGVPTGLTAVVQTNGQGMIDVVLTWSPVATGNVTNYLIERADGLQASGGPYTVKGETSGTSFTDTSVSTGMTYYYVVQAANSGGLGPISQQVSVTTPTPPPPPPTIGWFDYEFNGLVFVSTFHPITNGVFVTDNDLNYAIEPNETGLTTYFISGQTPLSVNPTNGSSGPPPYQDDSPSQQTPLAITTYSNLTIAAVNQNVNPNNGTVEYSAVSTAQIIYQCATPALINATNAALFYINDNTTNVTYYYTTDGTDPLTNQIQSQSIISTNLLMPIGLNISSNFVFSIRAFRDGYVPSGLITNLFFAQNFQGNELTWGFSSGYCSSSFIASPGEWFYAPVTLTTLGSPSAFGLEFDMTVTNLGPDIVTPGAMYFQSMLMQPIPGTKPVLYTNIPPLWYDGSSVNPPPPGSLVNYNGGNFVNASVTNTSLNELAVGWYELPGMTNLFNTTVQNLFTYSMAYIELLPNGQIPNGIIFGGYAFQVPTNAQPGEQYEIQLHRPSAVVDGLGENGSALLINTPTSGSLSNGPINAIKIVTVGQPKYLAGDTYPFQWFNAGNFGNGDLITYGANDVQEVFNFAIYGVNGPPTNSDFYDAMDSAGGFGAYDSASGYWTNSNVKLNAAQLNLLFNINDDTTINEMAFGDGNLDVCDVWTTFVRSQFPNLYWFQRFYTNDTVNGVFGRVAQAITTQTNVPSGVASPSGGFSIKSAMASTGPVSITNTPTIHFAAGDYLASPGQTLSIPVTATVFGPAPLRMLMFNVNITPLDGSPALTTSVTFSPNAPFNNSSIYNAEFESNSIVNCAQAFLPTKFPISESGDVTGSNIIGVLNITIPANATSSSSYALSFAHASASPNGLISFPKTTYTGLITLSSRTTSTYNDSIPDSWRLRYFGTIYNELSVSNADADGTGMNNWQKYLSGLDPTDPTSVLKAGTDQPMAQSSQDLVLYWPSVNGQTYIIKRSPTLFPGQWTAISTNIGDGTYMEIHDTSGGPNRYYEVTTP